MYFTLNDHSVKNETTLIVMPLPLTFTRVVHFHKELWGND